MSPIVNNREEAPQPLLVTHLTPPQVRPNLVSRPRLLAAIDQGVECKLTLISTGPGYGKSTLAAEWLASSRMPAAWISLDEADNDPHTFFSYLAAALQTLDRELCPELQRQLNAEGALSVRSLVTTLVNELAVVTRPFLLILDDLHLIRSPEILEGFALLVQNMPHMMRVLVTSRTDPPLPLLRMRARGELLELRTDDLSFTLDETRQLLAGAYQLTLSESELREVQEWSEGWPVGLMLVGQWMQGHDARERATLLERLGGNVRFVQDYLWQETIEQQSAERRQLLLQTSLLDRFDAALCVEVTGIPDAGAMMKTLERENLFLIGLDGAGRWFRYHHLFAEVLRERLAQEYAPEEIRAMHARAARWYHAYGAAEEAARHALAAEDWELAIPLLRQICAELVALERISSLRQWLERVPLEVLHRESQLRIWLAWALVRQGNVTEALPILESGAVTGTADERKAMRELILLTHILRSSYHLQPETGLGYCVEALALVDDRQPLERGRILLLNAILHGQNGDVAAAEDCLREVSALATRANNLALHLMERNAFAGTLGMRSRLREAAELLRQVIATGDEWNHMVVHYAHWQLAEILIEWNDLMGAEELLANGYRISMKTSAPLHRPRFHQYLAEVAWARGDPERAHAELDRAIELMKIIGGDGEIRVAMARRARFWLGSGYLERTREWARESGLDPNVDPGYPRLSQYFVLLRLMVLDGRSEGALAAIEPAMRRAERTQRASDVLKLHLLRAIGEQALGRQTAAQRSLQQAMQIGEPERYVRTFVDYGQMLAPLLVTAAQMEHPQTGYAQALLKAMGLAGQLDQALMANMLSAREMEILQLIAAGDSNRQIADRLFISEQTVKKHVSNVFEKLSVGSRTQAIDRGRRLGLLQ